MVERMPSPGYASFVLDGKTPLRLDAVLEPGEKELFFIFSDPTAGKTSYGGGRFLYADPPAKARSSSTSTALIRRRARSRLTQPVRCRRPTTGCRWRSKRARCLPGTTDRGPSPNRLPHCRCAGRGDQT
jgi:hypothetical protein